MTIVRISGVAITAVLGCLVYADYSYPPQKHGDMEARLTVAAADRTSEPGRGEVTLTLTVQGSTTLEVEKPELRDTTDSWKEERLTSTRTVEKDTQRATWSQVIRLKQVKPGVEAPPPGRARPRRSGLAAPGAGRLRGRGELVGRRDRRRLLPALAVAAAEHFVRHHQLEAGEIPVLRVVLGVDVDQLHHPVRVAPRR